MMQERLKKLIREADNKKTCWNMSYRYNTLISFGEDILADKISLTEKELVKYLSEYEHYLWDTEIYGGYNFPSSKKLNGIGLKIIEKYNLYKYIALYNDIFSEYSYSSEDKKIKDEYEEFLKIYREWRDAGRPEGEYIRRENYYK